MAHSLQALVAPSEEVSVLELAHFVAEAAGMVGVDVSDAASEAPASVVPMSTRPLLADAVPAAMALGLPPSVGLAEGIARTVHWFEARIARRPSNAVQRTSGIYERDRVAIQRYG